MSTFSPAPKVGLVLSGGGARGLAHIGVLKVLEREGIPIDCLAGTSMGGVIAAAYASGLSAAYIDQEALRMRRYARLIRLVDLSLPGAGLVEGKKIQDYLTCHLGDRTFNDLEIPLALVAVDLREGKEVVLQEGSVVEAVRATISVPGIFAPVLREGQLLVDGGILNDLPVDVARQMGAGVVIAVDVSMPLESLPDLSDRKGGRLPLPHVPLAVGTLRRSVSVMMAHIQAQRLIHAQPDVLIRPELNREAALLNGFSKAEGIVAAGEEAAEHALAQIRQHLGPLCDCTYSKNWR